MRRQQQDKQRYDTMMMKGHPKRPSASAARDSDYGTDELSSDTMNRMPRSVVNARRAARRGRKNDNSGHSSSYAGSSSDQGNSETILAPWLKIGDRKLEDLSSVTLCDEVMSFGHFMSLTDDEKASRNMIRSTLQELAQAIWPTSTVKIYGSFAYGLSLPNSDIDVVIEDCDTPLQNSFHQFVMHIGQNGYENLGTLDGSGADAFIKARHLKSNLIANVTLTASKSPVRSSVSVIKQQLQTYPAASSVIMVIRTVLSQCNLNDVPSGGLSSFSVIIMLIYLCQLRGDPGITAGTLLKDFLQVFGNEFDIKTNSVALSSTTPADLTPKVHVHSQLSICDPLDPDNNIADTCTKYTQIRSMFRYCHMALAKWDVNAGDAVFRGRTPLSTIIAHKALWPRLNKFQINVPMQQHK